MMSGGYGYMGYQNENIFITGDEKTYRIDPLNETLYEYDREKEIGIILGEKSSKLISAR